MLPKTLGIKLTLPIIVLFVITVGGFTVLIIRFGYELMTAARDSGERAEHLQLITILHPQLP